MKYQPGPFKIKGEVHFPNHGTDGQRDSMPGHITVRDCGDGEFDDGYGFPVLVKKVDGMIIAHYKGYYHRVHITMDDWPFGEVEK